VTKNETDDSHDMKRMKIVRSLRKGGKARLESGGRQQPRGLGRINTQWEKMHGFFGLCKGEMRWGCNLVRKTRGRNIVKRQKKEGTDGPDKFIYACGGGEEVP